MQVFPYRLQVDNSAKESLVVLEQDVGLFLGPLWPLFVVDLVQRAFLPTPFSIYRFPPVGGKSFLLLSLGWPSGRLTLLALQPSYF